MNSTLLKQKAGESRAWVEWQICEIEEKYWRVLGVKLINVIRSSLFADCIGAHQNKAPTFPQRLGVLFSRGLHFKGLASRSSKKTKKTFLRCRTVKSWKNIYNSMVQRIVCNCKFSRVNVLRKGKLVWSVIEKNLSKVLSNWGECSGQPALFFINPYLILPCILRGDGAGRGENPHRRCIS